LLSLVWAAGAEVVEMKPSLHYKASKYIVSGIWLIGLLSWWLFSDTKNVTPVVLLLLGTFALIFLGSKIPARCPGCGERRAYVFREQVSDDRNAIKYKCSSCGHVEDTGIHEPIGGE
jgi:hypothetical protein